jgi:hypothetical protein
MQLTNRKMKVAVLLGLAVVLVLSACRAPVADDPKSPTQDINALYTQVAGTLIAQGQQQAATATTGATNTPIVITATPTFTSTPAAGQPTATNTSAPATARPVAVCNQATFVTDVTVKDGTQMSKGEDFTKTWRIRNSGTCSWDDDYTVVFEGGTNLANKSSFSLPSEVDPGETVDISIAMEAPDENGTYRSEWVIRSDSGSEFGVNGSGGGAGVPFYAIIRVGAGGGNSGGTSGDVKYDFADNACDAKWRSDSKNNLPCPGANQGNDGFVIVLQDPDLESRQEDEPAIWMRPNHDGGGYISGTFPKYTVKNDDHFVAVIGCLDNNSDCRVTFTLSYLRDNGNEVVLGSWDERSDNLTRTLDIDLSSLAGDEVRFILTVDTGNNSFKQANAFWFQPQIVNE